MKTPLIPISFGELFDKLTILQIKLDNLKNQNALENVKIEYNQLFIIYDNDFSKDENAKRLLADLKQINEKLWDIEDKIRDKERDKAFDEEFIELARSVYITNDERARIKKNINNTFRTELVEEKSYSDY
jgi:hypothetical protein